MKQLTKLRLCDWTLVILTMSILISGIQLEILHRGNNVWRWVHIVIAIIFMLLCVWHIWLHFRKSNWFKRFHKQKSTVTEILWWISLLTFLSGMIAFVHMLSDEVHSVVGGIHGKLGFLMVIFIIAHALKRRKFFL